MLIASMWGHPFCGAIWNETHIQWGSCSHQHEPQTLRSLLSLEDSFPPGVTRRVVG
jgi:hypothetical protein